MDWSNLINSVGLGFDIAGAILLFLYGLPKWVPRDNEPLIIDGGAAFDDPAPEPDTYTWKNQLGLGLLVLGFIFQLISNFIPSVK